MSDSKKDGSNDLGWLLLSICFVIYQGCDASYKFDKLEKRMDVIERKLTDVHNWIDIERTKANQ